jgi:uncharacterized protein (DUF1330 family)
MEDEMVAYWVARSKVNNPDQYKKYTDLVPGILQKFGGKILARGGKFKILEGPGQIPPLRRHRVPELREGGRLPRIARIP